MAAKIINKKDYILVQPQELDYWEIFESLGKLFKKPEYLEKSVIWIFREGQLKLTYDDLYKIKAFVNKHYPENAKPDKKVAIVVETGLHTAMAKDYASIIGSPAPEFRVFSDLASAEDWIVNK